MQRLVLWDVDGTLLKTNGTGTDALHRALSRVVGRTPPEPLAYAMGTLDPAIVALHLEALEADPGIHLPAVLAASVEELHAARDELVQRGEVMPGVREVLAALADRDGVLQTLLTGNVRANAILKTSAFALDQWLDFDVGAYGEDAEERHALVGVVLERVQRLRGRSFDPAEAWVVGDTAHDLACARRSGARCLLVDTGWGLPDGAGKEADAFMADLSDTAAVVDVILGP
ncbi:MAG TPA: haloacid dehalogenase-like hydrolase [Acidimicrobiales bacterium]|nr:haloacid dehalogenase-like hydrolase [Acidimicrobiales bacterium]